MGFISSSAIGSTTHLSSLDIVSPFFRADDGYARPWQRKSPAAMEFKQTVCGDGVPTWRFILYPDFSSPASAQNQYSSPNPNKASQAFYKWKIRVYRDSPACWRAFPKRDVWTKVCIACAIVLEESSNPLLVRISQIRYKSINVYMSCHS